METKRPAVQAMNALNRDEVEQIRHELSAIKRLAAESYRAHLRTPLLLEKERLIARQDLATAVGELVIAMIYVGGAIAFVALWLRGAKEKSFLETMWVLPCFLVYLGFWLRGRRKEAERRHAEINKIDAKIDNLAWEGGTSE